MKLGEKPLRVFVWCSHVQDKLYCGTLQPPDSSLFAKIGLLKVTVLWLVSQFFLTLVTPWMVAHQAPLPMGILQARILKWLAMPSSRESSQSGIKSTSPTYYFVRTIIQPCLIPKTCQNCVSQPVCT